MTYNGTRHPERIRTRQQEDALLTELREIKHRVGGGGHVHYHDHNGRRMDVTDLLVLMN